MESWKEKSFSFFLSQPLLATRETHLPLFSLFEFIVILLRILHKSPLKFTPLFPFKPPRKSSWQYWKTTFSQNPLPNLFQSLIESRLKSPQFFQIEMHPKLFGNSPLDPLLPYPKFPKFIKGNSLFLIPSTRPLFPARPARPLCSIAHGPVPPLHPSRPLAPLA